MKSFSLSLPFALWSLVLATMAAGTAHAGLSFEERVACATAVEQVYWRHRTVPSEASAPKRPFAETMPRAVIEAKVTDTLRRSKALEVFWRRPISHGQLQAEMDRMARLSQSPQVLREIFEALGNDPERIAECAARPLLAERLVHSAYAFDSRFHGDVGSRAEREWARLDREGFTRGAEGVMEREWVRAEEPSAERLSSGGQIAVQPDEWEGTLARMAAVFATPAQLSQTATSLRAPEALPVGRWSPLQEDDRRFYSLIVVEQSETHLRVATAEWPKQPFDEWWDGVRDTLPSDVETSPRGYRLPAIAAACTEGTWAPTSLPFPTERQGHTAVWTGSEMIVWGGENTAEEPPFPGPYPYSALDTGARYDPATDTWTATSVVNAPSPRRSHTAVWTGSEMIVWGGVNFTFPPFGLLQTGARYDPTTDTWTATNVVNAPSPRAAHTAVWTGSEMIVWGGSPKTDTGGRYDPVTDTWTATSTSNAPLAREVHTAVWTGGEMIVWGGRVANFDTASNTGGRYDPVADTWTATETGGAPSPRFGHTAVWTGSQMVVWGGVGQSSTWNTGGRYDPATNQWTPTDTAGAPTPRYAHTAVWTGNRMIVWSGSTGGRYDPTTDTWTATSVVNAPTLYAHTAVWAGSEMIVWGGYVHTGGRYDPATDTWMATNASGAVSPRGNHTALWTGSEMIVWGGEETQGAFTDGGGRYDPATDNWRAMSMLNAPSARAAHTAVWTGREMIVWGGYGGAFLDSGGRYDPATDTWTATSTVNAPAPGVRVAVWTGRDMIAWGWDSSGGRYDPLTDTWAAMSTPGAPVSFLGRAVWTGREMIFWESPSQAGRYDPVTDTWRPISSTGAPNQPLPTAVWTGREMILWGGFFNASNPYGVKTGARYDPVTDTWRATSTVAAPRPRYANTAVWTGRDMIVWGGSREVPLSTGGHYDPVTDTWRPTSARGAPSPREFHTAVWTGREMIVWGGWNQSYYARSTGGRYCAQGNKAPIANDDAYATNEDVALNVPSPGVLGNDSALDGDPLNAFLVSGPTSGTLVLNPNGSLTYTPNPLFNGTDRFTYRADDGRGGIDMATVTLTVVGRLRATPSPLLARIDYGGSATTRAVTLYNDSALTVSFQLEELDPAPGGVTDIPWLSVNPTTGSLAPVSTQAVTASFDAAGLSPGLRRARLRMLHDSPYSVQDVPVCFTVGFLDVSAGSFAESFVHALAGAGVTRGCGLGVFCPSTSLSRAMAAVWLLRALEGPAYQPPPATGTVFGDVPAGSFAADFIEELARRAITSGCGGGNFCPNNPVTRAQAAKLLLKAREGPNYFPPYATGIFDDVFMTNPFVSWIEEIFRRGITSGCGGPNFCPSQAVSRAQMSAFVVRTFGLPMCGS